jgi:hypothetical protein
VLITRYNLNNKPLTEVDFYYLFSLSDANIPELLEVSRDKKFETINGQLRNYTDNREDNFGTRTFKSLMNEKLKSYLYDYNKDWRSWDFRDQRILHSLNLN